MMDFTYVPVVIAFNREVVTNWSVWTDPNQRLVDVDGAIDGKSRKNFLENWKSRKSKLSAYNG